MGAYKHDVTVGKLLAGQTSEIMCIKSTLILELLFGMKFLD